MNTKSQTNTAGREHGLSTAVCSVRLAHAITEYQNAAKTMRAAEESLALSVSPFMAAAKDDEARLVKLSFVMPNAKVTRRIYERIYQLQDLSQNNNVESCQPTDKE